MTISRGLRRLLYGLIALALIVAAIISAADPTARVIALHYLERAGISARLDNVDVNLFTGTLVVENARGGGEAGGGFQIARLRVSIDYLPLLSRRLNISQLTVVDAALDVRRGADNTLYVAGTPLALDDTGAASRRWGLALAQMSARDLRVHYRQPARGDQPAIDREILFNDTGARDVVTWQPKNDVPLNADLQVDDSHLHVSGSVTPFGPQVTAQLSVVTQNLALDLLDPITRASGLERLHGAIDSEQTITLDYDRKNALKITFDGESHWANPVLGLDGGPTLSAEQFDWQGRVDLQLLRAEGKAATVATDGTATSTGLVLRTAAGMQLVPKDARWAGTSRIEFAADATRLESDGHLQAERIDYVDGTAANAQATRYDWQGRARAQVTESAIELKGDGRLQSASVNANFGDSGELDIDTLDWQTKFTGRVADLFDFKGDGPMTARRLRFEQADGFALDMHGVDWQGTLGLDGEPMRLSLEGVLATADFGFDLPAAIRFGASRLHYDGRAGFDLGGAGARSARGRLITTSPRLDISARPLALRADRLVFNGDYSEVPVRGTAELELRMAGDMTAQAFAAMNTAIAAPWLAMRDAELSNLRIDSRDSIAFARLQGTGVRVLGDTNTDSAVLRAATGVARDFELVRLRDYRFRHLAIDGANVHVRRNDQGMGVIAEYFPKREATDDATHEAPTTYAVDHFTLTGPAIAFTDVAVTPNVNLNGSALKFTLDGLDTRNPDQNANYQLALDVGAYGHLDSRGAIAPLARGGLEMEIKAWLRSLALVPLSGYLNAAMGRRIANGAADGTLNLDATNGQLDGILDTTLANFRLVEQPGEQTEIMLGLSMETALALVRGEDDLIEFQTAILGDVTNPHFSIRNLVREAVLAGVRTAVLSDYSPVGLLDWAKDALLSIGQDLAAKPVRFEPGQDYVRPEDRPYLQRIAQAMLKKPALRLRVSGYATPRDAIEAGNEAQLIDLALRRARAVQDYLAARDVNPARVTIADGQIDRSADAVPRAALALTAAAD